MDSKTSGEEMVTVAPSIPGIVVRTGGCTGVVIGKSIIGREYECHKESAMVDLEKLMDT